MKNLRMNCKILILLFTLVFSQIKSQTFTHGAGPINTAGGVGTIGTDHTYIGAGAGANSTSAGYSNSFFGSDAGNGNKAQFHNTFIGWHAGILNGSSDPELKANNNTFVGSNCGAQNISGGDNTFIGMLAGYNNIGSASIITGDANVYVGFSSGFYGNGLSNVMIGSWAGYNNTADGNSFLGTNAGYSNTSGTQNCFFGMETALNNSTGQYNTIMGFHAGYGLSGSSHSGNSFFGCNSGYAITTGGNNVFMGYNSGITNLSGSGNVFLGYSTGVSNSTGSNLTIIGNSADVGTDGLSNASAIGANTIVKNSNQLILGDNNSRIGLRLSNDATGPLSPLSVGGSGNSLYEVYSYNPSFTNGACAIKGEIASPTGLYVNNKVHAVDGQVTPDNGYNTGVYGLAYRSTASSNGRAYGVFGVAGNCSNGYNYGIYGAIVGSNTGYAGYFDGLVRTTNDVPEKPTAGSWWGYSDSRLKKDITQFKDGLAVLRTINPVSYKFNGIGGLDSSKNHIGVIAQDVQNSAPYCVGHSLINVKGNQLGAFSSDVVSTITDSASVEYMVNVLNYNPDGLFYVMINSIKQLDSMDQRRDSLFQPHLPNLPRLIREDILPQEIKRAVMNYRI